MKAVISLIFLLLLVGAFYDYFRRRNSRTQGGPSSESARLVAADNLPPTETGRMKVQSILEAVKQKNLADAKSSENDNKEADTVEVEKLPDPFDSDK